MASARKVVVVSERRTTYHDDDKIQPAPGVGEVIFEAQGQPLDEHFDEEDDGEDTVHVIQ